MGKFKVRYLSVRPQPNGKVLFYWQPNKALHEAGYRSRRLARETNLLADAIAEAETINADVDAWRAGTKPEPLKAYSLPWLIRLYCQDERFTERKDSTKKGYREGFKELEAWSARGEHRHIAKLNRQAVFAYKRALAEQSRHKSNKVMRVLAIVLQFAVDEGYVVEHPARDLKLTQPKPRNVVWTQDQLDRFCAAAAAAG